MVASRMGLALAFATAMTALPARVGADQPMSTPFRVIVNPGNALVSVDHQFLLDVFLRRTTQWPDHETVHPVDLPIDSPTRRRFSIDALRRPVDAVKGYWLQVIFSGRGIPPPELDSAEEVVRFVARTAGAIGYVPGLTNIQGTRAISVK
jgi:hypothetical protein